MKVAFLVVKLLSDQVQTLYCLYVKVVKSKHILFVCEGGEE